MNENEITAVDAEAARMFLAMHPVKESLPEEKRDLWDEAFNINEYAISQGWFTK